MVSMFILHRHHHQDAMKKYDDFTYTHQNQGVYICIHILTVLLNAYLSWTSMLNIIDIQGFILTSI